MPAGSLLASQQQQPTLTRNDASLTLVPNPNAGSEGEVDLHWDPNPDLNIFVLPSGILLPLSIANADYQQTMVYKIFINGL